MRKALATKTAWVLAKDPKDAIDVLQRGWSQEYTTPDLARVHQHMIGRTGNDLFELEIKVTKNLGNSVKEKT